MATLHILGSKATGVLIVKSDPMRVVHITPAEIAANVKGGDTFDTFFAKIRAGAEKVFAPSGGGPAPVPEFSFSAEMTEDEFAIRRFRAGPIAQAVGSAGADAGAAEYAARRWRSALDDAAGGHFSVRRFRNSLDAAAGGPDYSARRWRAAIEAEAGGDSADFAVRRWRAASVTPAEYDEGAETITRRWRSLPDPGAPGAFDTRRFRSAEEEKAAVEFTAFAASRWRVDPKADPNATLEVEEFIARRWRAIDGIETGDAAGKGFVPGAIDP